MAKPGAELSELTEVTVSLDSVDTGMETTSTVASASRSASASNSTVTDIGKFELLIFLKSIFARPGPTCRSRI